MSPGADQKLWRASYRGDHPSDRIAPARDEGPQMVSPKTSAPCSATGKRRDRAAKTG
jgi:hypothetical protein